MRIRSVNAFASVMVLGACAGTILPAGAAPSAAPKAGGGLVKITVEPAKVRLAGKGMYQQFLVLGEYADGRVRDVTKQAQLTQSGTGKVDIAGDKITTNPRGNGDVQLTATVGGQKATMEVKVQDVDQERQWSFANDIVPIFTKVGCNGGGCHGSPAGRGGFRLSLFGYEPDYDYDMITKEKNGARINPNQPSASLVLQKPTMQVPHQGGLRFKKDSEFYTRIVSWMRNKGADGLPVKGPEFDARLKSIEIYPKEWTLDKAGDSQQIVVMAVRDDGTTQDVTGYARYTTNDDQVAEMEEDGLVKAVKPGETSIMIRYLGGVGVVRIKVPRDPIADSSFANFKPTNYIDQLVLEKLKEVRIPTSDVAGDAEFMRRAYIDTIGMIPPIEEARAFLDSKDPQKREKLVDNLLNRPEYVDFWSLKWSDLFRNSQQANQDKGLQVFQHWIHDSVRDNKPWDQMARELITTSGSGFRSGPANWFNPPMNLDYPYPLFLAGSTSQVFLGIRIDCARCHNHPFEGWSQMDYYGFAAFFAKTKFKNGIDEDEKVVYQTPDGDVRFPRTGQVVEAKFLGGDVAKLGQDENPRDLLADWITNPRRNPWFSRSIANRLWNDFFGRGLVQPVDDYRLTNPAANEKLLSTMADKVVEYKFDLKKMMRDILLSRTYQGSSIPDAKKLNIGDHLYASHSLPRRTYAEVLYDAVSYATGTEAKIGPYQRAVANPNNKLGDNYGFLDLFGRSKREVACECERSESTNVTMVLNLLNGTAVNQKIQSDKGRVAQAVNAKMPVKQMIEEFYLATLSRRPNEKEEAAATKLVSTAPSPREGAEDLLWSLMNMKEFMFQH